MQSAWDGARGGRGRIVLLAGEPGIGKTRLAEEFLARDAMDAAPLWGRAWQQAGAPAYWPWVQALRAEVRREDPAELAALLGAGAGDVAQVIPEIREKLPDVSEPPALEPDQARFRFFDSLTTFLRNAAAVRPMLVVLDDLHWADAPSLLLLGFIAREIGDVPLLLIGAYRDSEVARDPVRAPLIGEVARATATARIDVGGLSAAECADYVSSTMKDETPAGVGEVVFRQTGGNPLFVTEVVRWLAGEGVGESVLDPATWERRLPVGVREVIARRLGRLAETSLGLLTLGAVVGPEFETELVEEIASRQDALTLDVGRVGELLDEAVHEGILVEVTGAPGSYRFAHALIREALVAALPASRRAQVHRAAGQALTARHTADLSPCLVDLVHHFARAGGREDLETARRHAVAAAERASASLAYEEAARLYRQALDLHRRSGGGGDVLHAEILLAAADAERRSGDEAGARERFDQVATLARSLDEAGLLARAALAYAGASIREYWKTDAHAIALMEDALARLGDSEPLLDTRLRTRLAMELIWTDFPRAERLSHEAVALARATRDPATIAHALRSDLLTAPFADSREDRLAHAAELLEAAQAAGDLELEIEARYHRCGVFLELDGLASYQAEISAMEAIARKLRSRRYDWTVAMLWASATIMRGDLERGERLAFEALELGQRAENPNAMHGFGAHLIALHTWRGRLQELRAPIEEALRVTPFAADYQAALAYVLAYTGDLGAAEVVFERLAAEGFGRLPRSFNWLMTLGYLAVPCVLLRDVRRAQELYDLLLPYADRRAAISVLSFGPVSIFLGQLAAVLGRLDDARCHFESAVELAARSGMEAELAAARCEYASSLGRRGASAADRERAEELLEASLASARRIGLSSVAARAESLRRRFGRDREAKEAGEATPTSDARPQREANVFRREGDYWTISFDGRTTRLKDMAGLRLLAQLLQRPGAELHVIQLVGSEGGNGERVSGSEIRRLGAAADGAVVARDLGDAGLILDARATAEYQRRLGELREEIAEAEELNDLGRVERARQELGLLTAQLVEAGRGRRAASHAERARLTVAKALERALARIRRSHPPLGEHFDATIRRGYHCSYTPDPRSPVSWEF